MRLPPNLDFDTVIGLSFEERVLLKDTKPESIGQARRVEGMTPNGCIRLLEHITKQRRRVAAVAEKADIAAARAISEAARAFSDAAGEPAVLAGEGQPGV